MLALKAECECPQYPPSDVRTEERHWHNHAGGRTVPVELRGGGFASTGVFVLENRPEEIYGG